MYTKSEKEGIKKRDREYQLSDFDTQKNEILQELRNVICNDLEDLVYRMRLSYDEIMDILNLKYIPTKKNRLFFKSRYIWSDWFQQHLKIYSTW